MWPSIQSLRKFSSYKVLGTTQQHIDVFEIIGVIDGDKIIGKSNRVLLGSCEIVNIGWMMHMADERWQFQRTQPMYDMCVDQPAIVPGLS